MNRIIAVLRERIKISLSVQASREFDGSNAGDMVVGTIRETDATIIRDDMMFVRVLSNLMLTLP